MTWRQFIPTVITLLAMLCGFFSMLLSIEGSEHFLLSAQFIMLAMVLDGLDGNVARLIKGTSPFGAELDTYVDLTAFGLAPAILIYQVALQRHVDWRILMTSLVVLSGVIRLARFKVRDPARGQKGYCGLPITASAGWVAMGMGEASRSATLCSVSRNGRRMASSAWMAVWPRRPMSIRVGSRSASAAIRHSAHPATPNRIVR